MKQRVLITLGLAVQIFLGAPVGASAKLFNDNPTLRVQADGSVKHLLSGFVCPAGLSTKDSDIRPWIMVCGSVLVVPRYAGSNGYNVFEDARRTRFEIAAGSRPYGSTARVWLGHAFPNSLAIGNTSVAAQDLTYSIHYGDDEVVSHVWGAAHYDWQVGIYAQSSRNLGIDHQEAIDRAVRDFSEFAEANRAGPAPERVPPKLLAQHAIAKARDSGASLEPTPEGVRHRESGFLCPLIPINGIPALLMVRHSRGEIACDYSSALGHLTIWVLRRDETVERLRCDAWDIPNLSSFRPVWLQARKLPTTYTLCRAEDLGEYIGEVDDLITFSGHDTAWEVGLSASLANLHILLPDERSVRANREFVPLSLDRSSGIERLGSIWNEVMRANSVVR